MPTKTRTPARRETAVGHLRDAIADLNQARDQAGQEARDTIDRALERLREAGSDMADRAKAQATDWQEALDRSEEDVRRELGRRAIRAQQSEAALRQMSAEIRRRKGELAAADGA
jgi:hypothetical protein